MNENEIRKFVREVADETKGNIVVSDFAVAVARKAIEKERHDCEIAVWMVRQEATKPDAPDEGVNGWLQEAEDRIRMRSNAKVTGSPALSASPRGLPG